ncbi:MAG: HNH endonuclease [Acidobacteria bacterium]|nr:MAG: HNH endonuclease [Acidobacteriota bacterium]
MRYWWVNQNQTYRQEIGGGYLWSPKRKTNDQRNPFYESMREVVPGDIIFSFVDTRIAALGIARSYCYESPKPTEFGSAGSYWGAIGWKVDVSFREISNRIRPKDHIGELRGTLPEKYSPLRPSGDGLQSVYLTAVSPAFAAIIFRLIGREASQVADVGKTLSRAQQLSPASEPTLEEWERRVEAKILDDRSLRDTEREALVQARRGQGVFRTNVQTIERACRVTKVEQREHLIASHVKPWRDSSNDERLNGENGLLLTPTIDHLFDKGFISFENRGNLIISPVADPTSLERMGIPIQGALNVGAFSEGQRRFLEYHRDNVLRMSEFGGIPR